MSDRPGINEDAARRYGCQACGAPIGRPHAEHCATGLGLPPAVHEEGRAALALHRAVNAVVGKRREYLSTHVTADMLRELHNLGYRVVPDEVLDILTDGFGGTGLDMVSRDDLDKARAWINSYETRVSDPGGAG